MSSLAIITARGGSKRIPRKNIKEFLGQPIIAYSIKAALESGIFDTVMVSTDDEEIADISRRYGAEVPFLRSEKTSNDFATTADVLREVIEEYKKLGREYDNCCVLYPTAPFVTGRKLSDAMEIITSGKADSVLPIVKFGFPPQRAFVVNDGIVSYKMPEFAKSRSQDLEPMYHDCGQFCCFKVDMFMKNNSVVAERTSAIIVPESEVQDIDTLEDWKLAEIKYSMMKDRV